MKKYSLIVAVMALCLIFRYAVAGSAPDPQGAGAAGSKAATLGKVGFVDISAITQKAKFALEIEKKVEADYAEKMKQYKARQATYAALLDEIDRQSTVLSEAAVNAKYKQAFQIKAQLDEDKFNIDKFLDDSEKKKGPAMDRILKGVQEVGQSLGYDMVLSRELLIYGRPAVDLTDEVIARLNAAPEPGPAAKSTVPAGHESK